MLMVVLDLIDYQHVNSDFTYYLPKLVLHCDKICVTKICLSFAYLRPMITSSVYSHISFYLLLWVYQHCLLYLMQLWDNVSKVIGSSELKRLNLTPDYDLFKRVCIQPTVIIVKNEFTHSYFVFILCGFWWTFVRKLNKSTSYQFFFFNWQTF